MFLGGVFFAFGSFGRLQFFRRLYFALGWLLGKSFSGDVFSSLTARAVKSLFWRRFFSLWSPLARNVFGRKSSERLRASDIRER
jgi:hypothetical protein